jgi:hypothetical protein
VIRAQDAEQKQNRPAFVPVVVGDAPSAERGNGIVLELGGAHGTP